MSKITPACAGKRFRPARSAASTQDHPRMCGEEIIPWIGGKQALGSPPHARGRGPDDLPCEGLDRITPACAGKRRCQCCTRWPMRDHPRMRGEEAIKWTWGWCPSGSPPHARGRVLLAGRRSDVPGITPARAGKSAPRRSVLISPWDHPRACGEEVVNEGTKGDAKGSPPRVRGRGAVGSNRASRGGITPARAGKRQS